MMKKSLCRNLTLLAFCGTLCVSFASCSKQDHFYKDLIVQREYAGKPDSLWIVGGDQRAKLFWTGPRDRNTEKLLVYWNDYNDSASTGIDHQLDTSSFIIENLPEGDLTFNIITIDNKGDSSLPVEISTHVSGDLYRENLVSRQIKHAIPLGDSSVIVWNSSVPAGAISTILVYQDGNGNTKEVDLANSQTELTVMDLDPEKEVLVKNSYLNEEAPLDTFYSEEKVSLLDRKPPNTFTFSVPSDASVDFVDFRLAKQYVYLRSDAGNADIQEDDLALQKTIDLAHLRGGGSKHNFATITSSRYSAFSAITYDYVNSWTYRNDGAIINLGNDAAAQALYDGLDENDRAMMKTAFDDHAGAAVLETWPIDTDDVLLFHSEDRDLYVAIKAIDSNPDDQITIEFKVSRF